MPQFEVTVAGQAVAWFTVTVEAASAEDAIRMVKEGRDEEQGSRRYDWEWDDSDESPRSYDVDKV